MRIIRLILSFFLISLSTPVWAKCGNLCNPNWWGSATLSDLQAELDAGADIEAREETGLTPLHRAAEQGSADEVQALLDAGRGY